MIKEIPFDISNNIAFPAKSRKVMLLIDGEFYRLEINKQPHFSKLKDQKDKSLNSMDITYEFYKEDSNTRVGFVELELALKAQSYHNLIGYKERPSEFFKLNRIRVSESFHGLGTPILSYVMNDIIKFNESQGKNLKIIFVRIKTDITKPFYQKFGARANSTTDDKKYNVIQHMIIDKPKVVGELPIELADDFDYSSINEENPYTSKKHLVKNSAVSEKGEQY